MFRIELLFIIRRLLLYTEHIVFTMLIILKRFKIAYIPGVPGGNVNILGDYSLGNSKQRSVYVHVAYSERFPR